MKPLNQSTSNVGRLPLKSLLLLCILLPCLAECSRDDRAGDVKTCTAEAEKQVPNSQLLYVRSTETKEQRHDEIGAGIAECMAAKGYRHDSGAMTDERCIDDVDYSQYCYLKAK